jgi:hypothetical protein
VKVSVLCPGAVATGFAGAARNWPSSLGAVPESSSDERAQAIHELVRSGTATGLDPTEVANRVVDAIHNERFMVLTEENFGPRAIASLTEEVAGGSRFHPSASEHVTAARSRWRSVSLNVLAQRSRIGQSVRVRTCRRRWEE